MIPAHLDPELLSGALEAARRALRRMDEMHVPPRLRDIAGRSGRLPAPFAKRLLTELDTSEWLRAEALQEIGEPSDGSGGESASLLFLRRPENWMDGIEGLARSRREAVERSEVKRLESELRKAVARSGQLEEKLATAERKAQEAATGVEERLASAASVRRRSEAMQKAARDKLLRQVSAAETHVARMSAENAELRKKLEEARSMAGKAATSARPRKVPTAWSLKTPSDIARHLDDINKTLEVAPAHPAGAEPVRPRSRLAGPPAGIRPDQAEAIVWLLGLPGPVDVAIDGWNAAHMLRSPPVPATRNRIVEASRRLILASAGKRQVTAVFDSSQYGESFSADDVAVRFVESADEELITMAKRDASRLVVITSDRRVREAVQAAGAVGLWSEALIEWLKTARTFRA